MTDQSPSQQVVDGSKVCNRCGLSKPISEFHKNSAASTGLDSRCKACKYTKKGRPSRTVVDGRQQCTVCKKWKSLEKFEKNKRCKNGYAGRCQSCATEKTSKWLSSRIDIFLRNLNSVHHRNLQFRTETRGKSRNSKKHLWTESCITPDYLLKLYRSQRGRCAITGLEMTHLRGKGKDLSRNISIDRIDSSKGYIDGNVQLVCKQVNLMKHEMDQEDFEFWCFAVLDARQSAREYEVTMGG